MMKSNSVHDYVTEALYDSIKANAIADSSWVSLDHPFITLKGTKKLSIEDFISNLLSSVNIEQRKGVDIVDISAEITFSI